MKITYKSVFSHLRIATAVTLTSAAAALAFVAVNPSGPLLARKSTVDEDAFSRFSKFRQDGDELLGNKVTRPGLSRDKGPLGAALQKFSLRAYPAADVPSEATLNAIAAFKHLKARGPAARLPSCVMHDTAFRTSSRSGSSCSSSRCW